MNFCVGLSTQHIMFHPLRQEDFDLYHTTRTKLFKEETMGELNSRNKQEKYRSRKASSLERRGRKKMIFGGHDSQRFNC